MSYLLLFFVAAIGIFYYNTISWLLESWIHNEYYSHGFLIPVVSSYIIWKMRKELYTIQKEQSLMGLAMFTGGIILQGISILWSVRFLSGISLLITIAGVVLYIYGWQFTKKIWFPLLFLLLMIPLPIVEIIAAPAQRISAIAASILAGFIGLQVLREGLVLSIPSGSFEVGLPCSGINSIISLFAIGIIFAYVLEGGKTMKYSILISVIPLALAGNVLRIVSVLAVANTYGSENALIYFHDFSSLLLFSVALIGLFLVGRCFGRLRFKKIF